MSDRTKVFLGGLGAAAAGALPLLASFDVIASDEEDFGAPRWFVATIGFLFVQVGAWLALTRTPDHPLTGLLRALRAPLLWALAAGFCLTVVIWSRRVHAGPLTRTVFLALAVLCAVAAARELQHAAGGLRRRPDS